MDDAKIPENPLSGNWQSLDIFIFSNGEQQTPPRKYHVTAQDLNCWEELRMTLAHLQYGNTNTVDLYTIDGQSLNTPLQVANGGTYVAVIPTEKFIPAGYNEYLMKASRSREKRSEKLKKSGIDPIGKNYGHKREIQNVKPLNKNIQNIITNSTKVHPELNKKNKAPDHVLQKRIPLKSSTLPRKQITPVFTKNVLKNKEKESKTSNEPNRSIGNTKGKDPNSVKENNQSMSKGFVQAAEINSPRSKLELIPYTVQTTETTEFITSDNTRVENMVDDKELIIVKQPDSLLGKSKSSSAKETRMSTVIPLKSSIEETKTSALVKDTEGLTTVRNVNEDSINEPKIPVINDISVINKNNTNLDDTSKSPNTDVDTKSLVAFIKEGEIINLNIKIIAKQGEVIDAYCNKSLNATEKCSQIDIDVNLQTVEKQPIKSYIFSNNEKTKVFCLDCNCCAHYDHNEAHANDHEKLESLPYLLPKLYFEQQYNSERCNCESRNIQNNFIETDHTKRCSAENPVKKVNATTSMTTLKSKVSTTAQAIIPTSMSFNAGTGLDVTQNESIVQKDENYANKLIIPNTEVVTPDGIIMNALQKKNSEPLYVTKTISNSHYASVGTQTEWSSLVIEPRRHGDGRYSFHFPPLNLLKYHLLL